MAFLFSRQLKVILSIFGGVCLYAEAVHANLSASPVIVEYRAGGETRQDIEVGNSGTRPQYLEISAARIDTPGEFPETLTEHADPAIMGLLVAPRRLVLQPGETKIVRVILIERDIPSDKAWRVHIRPVSGEIESGTSVAVVNVGYKALVYARPEAATADLKAERRGRALTVRNTGNTNVLLHSGQQCPARVDECKRVAGKRVWPGASWTTELPHDGPVTFTARGHAGESNVTY